MRKLALPDREDCKIFIENQGWVTVPQAMAFFSLSRSSLMKAAAAAGAERRVGGAVRIDLPVMYDFYAK